MLDLNRVVRVVVVRGAGRIHVGDFALRPGHTGLSLFACNNVAEARMIVNAVREAGKSGTLGAAEIEVRSIQSLGLELVATPGRTPDQQVNDWHVEARLSRESADQARRLGQDAREFFNQQLAAALCDRARIIYEDDES
jgi:hypothetical protein